MKNFFAATLLLGAFSLQAGEPDLTLLKASLPDDVIIKSVKPSVLAGLYEVQINSNVIYLSEDGEKVISGDLYDLKEQVSHTDKARNGLRKAALAQVKSEDKIIYKAKNEKYKITVFTDISCPYCTKLHEHMDDYNDKGITVEYLAYPRAGAGSKQQKNMQKIWCAEDKAAALTEAKINRKIPTEDCDGKQTLEQFALGDEIGINATPTIVFSDGEIQPGYMKPGPLLQTLQEKFSIKQ